MNRSYTRGVPFLEIGNVFHSYGGKPALKDASLEVKKSEVLALLGPSGSGKSTLLAVIAGIIKPDSGKVALDGRDLLVLPPASRGIGMVFQDFALWPHMTVAENVAFPLRARRRPPDEVKKRVEEALKRVDLQGFEGRRPHELSGGQQQRVALARAIIGQTQLLLLDEPLSALDPATRSVVRNELADILRTLNLTTIIVTHDREEAFELADQVAVLVDGVIQQNGRPAEVYERPANLTVARFMGVNVLPIEVLRGGEARLRAGASRLELPYPARDGAAHLVIAPERTWISENHNGSKNVVPGRVLRSEYLGGAYRLQVRIGDINEGPTIEARSNKSPGGETISLCLPVEAIHVLHENTLAADLPRIEQPEENQSKLQRS